MNDTSKIPSPCFVLDERRLVENLELIDHVQQEAGVTILLAFKGFAMWSALSLIKKYVAGATASSLNEVLLCSEHMQCKSHTYCVAYDPVEFEEIAARSSNLTFNSINQYKRFVDQIPEDVSIGMRVNPGWSDVTTDLYNPSSPDSRLGVTELVELPDKVEGLHFHVLCESGATALKQVLDNFEERFGHLLSEVKWINMGGGHLITRSDYEWGYLVETLRNFKSKHDVEIILEPGSAFAWEAGFLKTSVLDIVENAGIKTAIINASFTCHMPDCLEMPYRPTVVGASELRTADSTSYRIGGVSCLAGDFLEEYFFEQPLEIGDEVVFLDMMHYTMVKTTTFNGVKHPSIGILKMSGDFELIKKFEYSDYRDKLS